MTPEELYEENQSLVWFTLKKYFPSLKVDEDVLQVCRIGLWQACAEYYPEKGAKFSTFAVKGIFMAPIYPRLLQAADRGTAVR